MTTTPSTESPEELQALVGGQPAVLVGVRAVGQGERRAARRRRRRRAPASAVRPGPRRLAVRSDRRARSRARAPSGARSGIRPGDGPGGRRTGRSCGHAVCGGFGCPQALFGQAASVGGDVFHCERRARVFARDIRRLGTATVVRLLMVELGCAARRRSAPAGRPSEDRFSHAWSRRARRPMPVRPARAQPGAVLAAQRRVRQLEQDRVAHRRLEVDLSSTIRLTSSSSVVSSVTRVRVGVELGEVDVDVVGHRPEAARALPDDVARPPCRWRGRPRRRTRGAGRRGSARPRARR